MPLDAQRVEPERAVGAVVEGEVLPPDAGLQGAVGELVDVFGEGQPQVDAVLVGGREYLLVEGPIVLELREQAPVAVQV